MTGASILVNNHASCSIHDGPRLRYQADGWRNETENGDQQAAARDATEQSDIAASRVLDISDVCDEKFRNAVSIGHSRLGSVVHNATPLQPAEGQPSTSFRFPTQLFHNRRYRAASRTKRNIATYPLIARVSRAAIDTTANMQLRAT